MRYIWCMYDDKGELKPMTMNFPKGMIERIDELVSKGFYASRSEFIRTAVNVQLRTEASA